MNIIKDTLKEFEDKFRWTINADTTLDQSKPYARNLINKDQAKDFLNAIRNHY